MKLAVIGATDLGWKTVRRRWEKCLPSAFEDVRFFHPESFEKAPRALGSRSLRQLLNTRAAAAEAISSGYRNILVSTNTDATLLPRIDGIRYLVYADASHSQARWIYSQKPANGRMRFRIRRFTRLMSDNHVLLGMSNWAADGCQKEYALSPAQVAVLPPPVDTELFSPEVGAAKPLRILFLGGDFVRKGGPLLLEVAGCMPECQFVFVTKHVGDSRNNVAFFNGLKPETTELLEVIRSCQMLTLPTTADCSPLAAIEAQSSGLPVIITDVGATREIVKDGVSGTILKAAGVKELRQAIQRYADDLDLQLTHGRNGREMVMSNNSLPMHSRRLAEIVRSCGL